MHLTRNISLPESMKIAMKKRLLSCMIIALLPASLNLYAKSVAVQPIETTTPITEITRPLPPIRISVPQNLTEIELKKVNTRVEIIGSLAETTIDIELYNPNARQLEATLEFPLAEGQQITGLALDINNEMREAVPVPKNKGRQVFEAIERRNVDPALLEQTQGNNFKLRIFPVSAHGIRKVQIRYQQALDQTTQGKIYRLPMRFANQVDQFDLKVYVKGVTQAPNSQQLRFKQTEGAYTADYQATQLKDNTPIEVILNQAPQAQLYTQRFNNADYFYAEIPVSNTSQLRQLPQSIGILWDASLSARQRDLQSELALLDNYFQKVQNATVELTLLRHKASAPQTFKIKNGDWSALKKQLENVTYDGATQLTDWKNNKNIQEYLLFSDGLENYGVQQNIQLNPDQRLYSIQGNAAQLDHRLLRQMAEQHQGQYLHWQNAEEFKQAQQQLLIDQSRLIQVDGNGISELQVPSYFPEQGIVRIMGKYSALVGEQTQVQLKMRQGGQTTTLQLPFKNAVPSNLIAPLWAREKVAVLSQNKTENAKKILTIGQEFNIVTADTSLIVLENLSDYLQYEIEPPASLRKEYQQARNSQILEKTDQQKQAIEQSVTEYAEHKQWWNSSWPKRKQKHSTLQEQRERGEERYATASVASVAPVVEVAPVEPVPAPVSLASESVAQADAIAEADRSMAARRTTNVERAEAASTLSQLNTSPSSTDIKIEVQAWKENAPYVQRLENANKSQAYQIYLDERAANLNNPSFYLTVTDIFMRKGMDQEALQVISNLAELNLENRHVLRILGQQLMLLKQPKDAIMVYQKVLSMAEEEPQSWRDLALAYAENKQYDEAIQTIYHVVTHSWDDRFGGINLIAVDELNNFIAKAPRSPAIKAIDPRLIQNLPVSLRVVLSWDSDNSDMDLWVIDPNGEKTFYSHQLSSQGGKLSDDFTGGYGPEVFWLKDPIAGEYTVKAHYYGDRQQVITGETTAFVRLIRNWGKPNQSEQVLRVKMTKERLNADDDEAVLIGKFTVK